MLKQIVTLEGIRWHVIFLNEFSCKHFNFFFLTPAPCELGEMHTEKFAH